MFNSQKVTLIILTAVELLIGGGCHRTETSSGPTSFGDFEFQIPAGWTKIKPDRNKTAASIILSGKSREAPDGLIKVDVGQPTKASAVEIAKALAGPDGIVDSNPVQVDGIDGFKVTTSSTDLSRPKYAIVIFRGNTAYLLMAAGNMPELLADDLERIRKTWKWTK